MHDKVKLTLNINYSSLCPDFANPIDCFLKGMSYTLKKNHYLNLSSQIFLASSILEVFA